MGFVNGLLGDFQSVRQGGCAIDRQSAAAAFEASEDLPRDTRPLGQCHLGETGNYAQISEGLLRFRNRQKALRWQSHCRGGKAQGVHQW